MQQLFYLIMSAKTRTRNEVMKSRKKLNENEIYGQSSFNPLVVTILIFFIS